jgi:hypothetical protein
MNFINVLLSLYLIGVWIKILTLSNISYDEYGYTKIHENNEEITVSYIDIMSKIYLLYWKY